MHWFSAAVDVTMNHHLGKDTKLCSFIGGSEGEVGLIPLAPHSISAQKSRQSLPGVCSAYRARTDECWGCSGKSMTMTVR